jgi:hypothetical protein
MANNRMYLVNDEGKRIRLAKYYPSTGWFFYATDVLMWQKALDEDDFPNPEDRRANEMKMGFGPPYSRHGDYGNTSWRVEYESDD